MDRPGGGSGERRERKKTMRRNEEYLPSRRRQGAEMSPWSSESFWSPSTLFSSSPWQMMRRIQEDMDGLFGQFFGGRGGSMLAPATEEFGATRWAPRMDVCETDKEWLVEAELPGVKPDNIHVEIQDHHLMLRAEMRDEQAQPAEGQAQPGDGGRAETQREGQRRYAYRERRYGFFERVLPLPENVDEQNARCEYRDGVLTIHLPKTEQTRPRGQRIPIESHAPQGQKGQARSLEPAMAGAKGGETSSGEAGDQGKKEGRSQK
jgi:HSP20 family protein